MNFGGKTGTGKLKGIGMGKGRKKLASVSGGKESRRIVRKSEFAYF